MPATARDIVAEWLALAEQDHEVASRIFDLPGVAAFHLQQAAEKALKAALVHGAVRPPRTHDLLHLRQMLGSQIEWPEDIEFLTQLTAWNVIFRYVEAEPGTEATGSAVKAASVRIRVLLDEVRALAGL
ncbi:hypothetical protein BZG35_06435 [Brevundimonas sp. LM2]|nr:hypothetical protein BZG35_06435 [Brevundimonas sp. LM2]